MQLSDMRTRVGQRLNESAGPVFYTAAEINAAVNEAQRFMVFLTLCLEITATWTVSGGTTFTHMLNVFSDWICPLRITDSTGAKIRPSTLAELGALDPSWIASAGNTVRYASMGADFIGLYQQNAGSQTLTVTYAQAPAPLVLDTDVSAIPAEYHPRLVDYGIYRCRQVEGGQEFAKALKYLESFFGGVQHLSRYVRDRNNGAKYDKVPYELTNEDVAKLVGGQQ